MTSTVSIRLEEKLLREMKSKADTLQLSQTAYIRLAIERMNAETERRERQKKMKRASLRVREESMKVNEEFGRIENDPDL